MKIGILQTGHVPEELEAAHGAYPKMFEILLAGNGFTYEAFPVVDGKFPESVRICDGWLITGSRYGAYEDHPWIPPLEKFIRNAYAADIPIVGICFGHQILAQALGGKVEKFGGLWGVGNVEYRFTDGSTARLHAMHQDQVIELPPDARVTASSTICENAALVYKGKAMSIQPHPEFTPEFMKELIRARSGTVIPKDQANPALESLEFDHNSARIGQQIADFFKQAVAEKAA